MKTVRLSQSLQNEILNAAEKKIENTETTRN